MITLFLNHPTIDGRYFTCGTNHFNFFDLVAKSSMECRRGGASSASALGGSGINGNGTNDVLSPIAVEQVDYHRGENPEVGAPTCGAFCPHPVDGIDAVVLGYNSGNSFIVKSGKDAEPQLIAGGGEKLVCCDWDPNHAERIAFGSNTPNALKPRNVKLVDVSQSDRIVSLADHSQWLYDVVNVQFQAPYQNQLVVGLDLASGGGSPTAGSSLAASSGLASTPGLWLIDPRVAEGHRGFGAKEKERSVGEVVACHRSKDYVLSAGQPPNERNTNKNIVQLWDTRLLDRPVITHRGLGRIAQLIWGGPSEELSFVAVDRDSSILRVFEVQPLIPRESFSGFGLSKTSGFATRASSHSETVEAYKARLSERRSVVLRSHIQKLAWHSVKSQAIDATKGRPATEQGKPTSPNGSSPSLRAGASLVALTKTDDLEIVNLSRGPSVAMSTPSTRLLAFDHAIVDQSPDRHRFLTVYSMNPAFAMQERAIRGVSLDVLRNLELAVELQDQELFVISRYMMVMDRLGLRYDGIIKLLSQPPTPRIPAKGLAPAVAELGEQLTATNLFKAIAGWTEAFRIDKMVRLTEVEQTHRPVVLALYMGRAFEAADHLLQLYRKREKEAQYIMLAMLLKASANEQRQARQVQTTEQASESEDWGLVCSGIDDESLGIALSFYQLLKAGRPKESDIFVDSRVNLLDRVALILHYFNDDETERLRLFRVIYEKQVADASIRQFIFSGLNGSTAISMQDIIDRTGLVQWGCILFAAVEAPVEARPVSGSRSTQSATSDQMPRLRLFTQWDADYRSWLNTWGLWHARARYDVQLRALDRFYLENIVPARSGALPTTGAMSSGGFSKKAVETQLSQLGVALQCQCGQSLHGTASLPQSSVSSSRMMMQMQQLRPQNAQHLTSCPNPECRLDDVPICAVCCAKIEPKAAMPIDSKRWFVWCSSCFHGGHWDHLQEWFETHQKCPVQGCKCFCKIT
jgi:hypothetical protein